MGRDRSIFHVLAPARSSTALLLLCGLCAATTAMAQNPTTEDKDKDKAKKAEAVEEVVVTGTRIQRNEGGYQAVQATSVVSAEEMKTLGATTVAEMIVQLPNNIGRVTPETVGDSPANLGGTIANLRGLNTSGGTRTLTLVDSRRFVATDDGGAVDLNVIPSALVSRTETVTGGASATYGADALAGVVNIILDKELKGVKFDTNWGETSQQDGKKYQVSLAAGTDLFDKQGHITFAYEHSKQNAIVDCDTREYCQQARGLVQNGSAGGFFTAAAPYTPRNGIFFPGQPEWIVQSGLRYGGLGTGNVWNDPQNTGKYYTFNQAGNALVPIWQNLAPNQIASIINAGNDGTTPFGTGDLAYNHVALLPQTTRDTAFLHLRYDLDDVRVQGNVSWSKVNAQAEQNSDRQMGYESDILPGNAYLSQMSASDQAILQGRFQPGCSPRPWLGGFGPDPTLTTTCIPIQKLWNDQLDRVDENNTDTKNFDFEGNGPIAGSWTWDAYVSYGRTERDQRIADWATRSRFDMAVDSVMQNGQPVCRVNAQGPVGDASRAQWLSFYEAALPNEALAQSYVNTLSAGCQPLNPFGYGASAASLAYSWPTYPINTTMSLKQISLSASGNLWKGLGAGAFKFAGGAEAYQDTTISDVATDPILASDFLVSYGGLWSGRTTNISPFAEIELPLVKDVPGVNYLMTNLAYRWTHDKAERLGDDPISSSRDVKSWKISVVYNPIESVRFRATRSSDVRAPSGQELYLQTASTVGSLFGGSVVSINNPFVPGDPSQKYNSETGGNPALKPETADNKTLGIVFTPSGMFSGFSASADYYDTTIKQGITSLTASDTLNGCYNEVTLNSSDREFCSNIVFGPPTIPGNPYSNLNTIATSNVNSQAFRSRGIDYSISYYHRVPKGSVNFRLLATHFIEESVDLGQFLGRRNVAGQDGSNNIGSFFGGVGVNYEPNPSWQGNFWATYTYVALASTLQIRYVGPGRLSNQGGWIGPGESGTYTDPTTGKVVGPIPYAANLDSTINNPNVPSWTVYNLHFNYSFSQTRFGDSKLGGLSLYAHIENVFNKQPAYYTGSNAGGINAVLYSGLGRQYQLGVHYQL